MLNTCSAFLDTAGGVMLPGTPFLFVDYFPTSVLGDLVLPHGENEHGALNTMVTGNFCLFVSGLPVCSFGSISSCGHIAMPMMWGSLRLGVG